MSVVYASERLANLDPTERRLLNDYQRDFPLVPRPFAEIARTLDSQECIVIDRLASLARRGYVSRVGPVFWPRRIGSSTLAALSVPEHRLEEVAAIVNAYREVNHNYAREHELNLWFVVTAPTSDRLRAVLESIAQRTSAPVISLPLEREFRIDLGFALWPQREPRPDAAPGAPRPTCSAVIGRRALSGFEQRLVTGVQDGLSIVARPFARVGAEIGASETRVLHALSTLIADAVIRRFGVVVHHHELGYRANAMVVWDVPDERVVAAGERVSRYRGVTLCYQRARRLPRWPYNLFCMVHGCDRSAVERHISVMRRRCGLSDTPYDILFSRRRYKQRGARYGTVCATSERVGPHG